MKYNPKFIEAWENYSGLTWAEDYQGGFGLSFRDFKAGWDACESHLTSAIHADGENEPTIDDVAFSCCGGIDAHRPNCCRR